MREKLRVFVPALIILGLCLSITDAWAESEHISDIPADASVSRAAVADELAVLFLDREVLYDLGKGFCPTGYKEGNFDGDGDAPDCRMKFFVAENAGTKGKKRKI